MAERTAYQNAVAAGITAAGHVVEWASDGHGREVLRIDGLDCGTRFYGERPRVDCVPDAVTYVSVWRARQLPAEGEKAAKVLLDRHASVLHQRQRAAKADKARRRDEAMEQTLRDAIGEVPDLRLDVKGERVEVALTFDSLSPESATLLGDVVRQIIGAR